MITLFLLFSAIGAEPASTPQIKPDDFMKRSFLYQDCVNAHGKRWAITDAPIPTIIETAIEACEMEKMDMSRALALALQKSPKDIRSRQYREWMEGTDDGMRSALTRIILDVRAKQATASATPQRSN